ncbi:DDE superfamily endonuclease [Streptomyces sp. 840.1]|uniref:transposase family protein n=1 Tax=Streptomyces sp. 840.1 TaxID=2485152 RepID=UPI000F9A8FCC|nr:transposase family protein [Streptomyces sp. 840.1]ROQ59591.1 DDE superfamily endonuclease [Streptomyces sp. 840.1]
MLLEELAPGWQAGRQSALRERRGGDRRRAAGAGPRQRLVLVNRLLVTLVHLRLGLPHAALAELYEVDRSTVSAAVRQVRLLLATRGFAVPDRPGLRLGTRGDVFAYADAEGVPWGSTGPRRRSAARARRPGRKAFVSGKKKQNTIKTTTFSDGQGRTLFSGVVRPGRMHDRTAVRTEGLAERFRQHPNVRAEVDEGYRGLANEPPAQVSAPPKKPKDDAPMGERHAWHEQRRRQPSARICVEHTNGEYKQWRPLQRFTGRRETYTEPHLAIAGLVSDRSARRPTRRKTSTELVLARQVTRCSPTSQPIRPAHPELNRSQGRNQIPSSGPCRSIASAALTHPSHIPRGATAASLPLLRPRRARRGRRIARTVPRTNSSQCVDTGVRGNRATSRSPPDQASGRSTKEWVMTTQYGNHQTGQQPHGAPRPATTGNVLSIIAIVLGVISLLFLPIVFGVVGLVLAIVAKTVRHERLAVIAIVVSAVGLVGGMILGAALA